MNQRVPSPSTAGEASVSRTGVPRLRRDPIEEAARQWTSHGWERAASGMSVLTSVFRVQQILSARVNDALRPFGITFARYEVLALLSFTRNGALPIGKLGERLQVHATSATNAVDRLESQELVVRGPHPTDRRAVLVTITDAGRKVVKAATPALNAVFEQIELNPKDARQLYEVLRRFRQAAGDFP